MCVAVLPTLDNKPGFLLMEALLALVLFSSFSIVIGMYWQHLMVNQKKAEKRLQALSYAIEVVDALIAGQEDYKTLPTDGRHYAVTIDKQQIMPQVKKGALTHLDVAHVCKITVALPDEQLQLMTIVPERV